jgi:histidinol-phosphate/aromatic aminotransferase/cobyric acid decarboxylase-like protein
MAEPTPTVYSYYTPEVLSVVRSTLNTINTNQKSPYFEGIHRTLTKNVEPGLDDLHLPLMEKYERFARAEGVIGLETYANKYFTSGSSEGIFHLLSQAKVFDDPVYQFEGEYQGYMEYATALDLEIKVVKDLDELRFNPPGTVILSNPASVDGNIVDPNVLTTILRNHNVILDLAYMGMTQKPLNVDLTQPGILAVVGSLSKPFGLYYYRIGFCYSRQGIASLYGNKWFKNALSIRIGEAVLDHFSDRDSLEAFKTKYFSLQEKAVQALNADTGYNLDNLLAGHSSRKAQPSDVWLLANAPYRDFDPKDLRPFKRYADSPYRFCLTPMLMELHDAHA